MASPSGSDEPDVPARRSGGRPRSPETELSILAAAADLLRAEGPQAFSISAVALQAGSSRTTVYRRWRSKEALLLDALASVFAGDPLPQHGNLLANLEAVGRDRRDMIHDALFQAALPLIVELSVGRTGLASQARHQLVSPFRDAFLHSYSDLAVKHEVRTDADPEMLLSMLLGAILYRVLLSQKIGNREVEQLSMLLVAAVQPLGSR